MGSANEHEGLKNAVRERRLRNNVRRLREDRLLSKAELARKAGVSPLTIDRVESGQPCRMNTKRKIILALGMRIEDKDEVFVPSAQPELGSEPSAQPPAERSAQPPTRDHVMVHQHQGRPHGEE